MCDGPACSGVGTWPTFCAIAVPWLPAVCVVGVIGIPTSPPPAPTHPLLPQPTLLSLTPRGFVLQTIALAAFPASAWVPLKPDGSQAWLHPPATAAEPAGPEAEPEAAAKA